MAAAETVEPEAEATEPESPDTLEPEEPTEPAEDDDDELEPESSTPRSEAELKAAMRALEGEADRHTRAVSRIMGEDALELLPCPLCEPHIPGFRFPVTPDDEQVAAVFAVLGLGEDAEYAKGDDARPCETCAGLGQVLTGSKVPEHRLKLCRECTGAGWVHVPQPGSPPAVVPIGTAPSSPPPAAEPAPDADPWGRRPGDPNYGVMPGYERQA